MKKLTNLSKVSGGNEVVRVAVGLSVAAITWLGIATYVVEKNKPERNIELMKCNLCPKGIAIIVSAALGASYLVS